MDAGPRLPSNGESAAALGAIHRGPVIGPDDPSFDRARTTFNALTGGYLNYASDDGADLVEGAFGAEAWGRLRSVKRAWDPDNVFRFNHNIPPAEQLGATDG